MMRRILSVVAKGVLGLVVLLAPVRIAATPERVITVGDRALGIGADHAYVLRVTEDSLGFRGFAVRDTYLLEIGLADGRISEVWPVQRVSIDEVTGGPVVRHLDMPGAVEPFAILSRRDAYALQPSPLAGQPRVALDAERLEITEAGPWSFAGETRNILDAVSAGLELTGAAIPTYAGLGDISVVDPTRASDLLSGRFYNADDCRARGVDWEFAPASRAPTAFLSLECAGDTSSASVVVPVAAIR